MSAIFTQIKEWIGTRPFWERAALDRVIDGTPLTSEDYDQLIQWCLEDAELRERNGERPPLKYLQEAEIRPAERHGPVKLVELSNVQNVNALAGNQKLSFHASLTAIFGANGSGKSGYARIAGRVGTASPSWIAARHSVSPVAATSTLPAVKMAGVQAVGEGSVAKNSFRPNILW